MRHILLAFLMLLPVCAASQTSAVSDPTAISFAQQSVAAMTGGATITDVTLNGSVTSILGTDSEGGTGTFRGKGASDSRVDLSLSSGTTRSDVRKATNNIPAGGWVMNSGTDTPYALHNCWTDPVWFFPALSSLTQTTTSGFVFKYIGQVQHEGRNTQHIQVFQAQPAGVSLFQQLSTMDFYLDSVTLLPFAVGFNVHPDGNAGVNLSVEIDFSNYQVIQGVAVPMHIQRYQQGALMLDATIQTVLFNQGLDPSVFSIN